MKGDALPSSDHVFRQCRERDLKREADGTLRGIFPHAFEPVHADGISVTWFEFFAGSAAEKLEAVRSAMNRGRKLRPANKLAKLNVGAIVAEGKTLSKTLAVTHDPIDEPPEKENGGHSVITGVAVVDDDDLLNRLANLVPATALEPAIA